MDPNLIFWPVVSLVGIVFGLLVVRSQRAKRSQDSKDTDFDGIRREI